jgi:hypothetical protein
MLLKAPPRIKILEAAGALADGRVRPEQDHFRVVSSAGEVRVYTVRVDGLNVASDDNGTTYRGYVGYPIIAVLMYQGKLPYEPRIGEALRGIQWKKLNDQYKNYSLVEKLVLELAAQRGVDVEEVERYVQRVMRELRSLRLEKNM